MKGTFSQPVIFNIITIVALLFSLAQMVQISQKTSTSEAVHLLAELSEENEAVDETLSGRLAADQNRRLQLANFILITKMIAILANVIANYIGRGRHFTNTARIRELEAELRGLRAHR